MRSRPSARLLLTLGGLVVACSAPQPALQPLDAYERAKQMAWNAEPRAPPVFLQPGSIPDGELVPYAYLTYVSHDALEQRERVLWRSALREMPDAILPLSMKESGVVTALRAGAEKSGILVGDTIESIAGRRVEIVDEPPLNTSDHIRGRLYLAPGQPVELIGYRSGGARVDGSVETEANPRSWLSLRSSLDVTNERIEVRRAGDGRSYWIAVPDRR